MRVALVTSSYLPTRGPLERHVDRLARGLAMRGADVEIVAPRGRTGGERLDEAEGVRIRRLPFGAGSSLRFPVTPRLWGYLRAVASTADVVDVHTTRMPLAAAFAAAGGGRMVLTPHAPVESLVAWPYSRMASTVVSTCHQIVCTSVTERDELGKAFPEAALRITALRPGVDVSAIRAARPYPVGVPVLLAVGGSERRHSLDRAIATLLSLDPSYRLVVVGTGPGRGRVAAYAHDLKVNHRVDFVGPVSDSEMYSWLRTASVVLSIENGETSGLNMLEALAAGAPVVASDIPVHREAAAQHDAGTVVFVPPAGSPLDVADAVQEASRCVTASLDAAPASLSSWDRVVDDTWDVYRRVLFGVRAAGRTRSPAAPSAPYRVRWPRLTVESRRRPLPERDHVARSDGGGGDRRAPVSTSDIEYIG